jgi:hypothetical protein
MSGTWTCDRNHHWTFADTGTVDLSPACPKCGGPGRQLGTDDTLPPADEPFPFPPLADVRVPGYELLAELGRGAMGVVYRAREEKLGRLVALKMILAGGHASRSDRARFQREAEAVAALRHPQIVQIYAVGESGGLPYCALEYVEGGNLADQLGGKPLPPEKAATLVEQLARAVQFAHEHGIVHRDLKPANVLLDTDGTPKIADFGLAKKLGSGTGPTATGAVLGTPAYMAPEQAGGEGKVVGPAADTYALGAILYELLTGRPPFKAATALDTILQVISVEPPPPRAVNPKVPRDLETVTLKCLRKEPGRRYASAADLAEDLRRWRSGEPVMARPQGRGERLWRAAKRRRGWLIAGGMSGLALLLAMLLQPKKPLPIAPGTVTPPPSFPAAPQLVPSVITAATFEQAKEAVVAVRSTRSELTTTGSGFMAVEPGIVVTTLLVLGMDHPLTPPPDRIEITILPGRKESHKTHARLLSVDRTASLACLQISGIGLPPPLALGRTADIQKAQRVYVAGIPAKIPTADIEPTLNVRESAIAMVIPTRDWSVQWIQINGGGTSEGAALIAADGRLVGTALAGPANMQFAIPAESVGALLRERIQSLRLGQAVVTDKGSRLPVTARVADPINRLWKLSLDVCVDDPGWTPRNPDGKPKGLVGDSGRKTFSLTPSPNDRAGPGEDRDFVGEIDLPPLPAGKVYWVQPHFRVSRGGQVGGPESLGDAMPLADAGPPVERVPVRLTLDPGAWSTAERRLDLVTHRRMNVDLSGKGGVDDRTENASLAERFQAAGPDAAAKLHWRVIDYAIEGIEINKQTQKSFADAAKGLTAEVDLDANGSIKAIRPDFSTVSNANRPLAEGLSRSLTEVVRGVNRQFAGRDLQPGASWPAESPFVFPSGRAPAKGMFHLTLTYVGSRERAGRREAIIEVSGEMAPSAEKDAGGNVVGRTVGAYSLDVETGMVRMARVESEITFELEMRGPGSKLAKTKVGMVIETRFQRRPSDGPPMPAVIPLPNGRIDFRPFVPLPNAAPP